MPKRKVYRSNPRVMMNVETQEEAQLMAKRLAGVTRRVIVIERPKKPAGQWKVLTQADVPGWERTALRQIARGLITLVLFELNEEARKALADVKVIQLDAAVRDEEPEKEQSTPFEEGLAISPTAAANERSWDAVGTGPDTHAPDGERLPPKLYHGSEEAGDAATEFNLDHDSYIAGLSSFPEED